MDEFEVIPQDVLLDYQNRTIESVTNVRWADAANQTVDGDVLFTELAALGPVPFSASANADTDHGRLFWTKANSGDYGPIGAFIHPTIDELRSRMKPMTPRVFWKAARNVGVTKDAVLAQINLIEDEDIRADTLIDLQEATYFERLNPTLIEFSNAQHIPPEQLDALWVYFAT